MLLIGYDGLPWWSTLKGVIDASREWVLVINYKKHYCLITWYNLFALIEKQAEAFIVSSQCLGQNNYGHMRKIALSMYIYIYIVVRVKTLK